MHYYLALILGGVFIAIGFTILILVVKFLHGNRVKHTITALIFLIGGVGIVVILTTFTLSPQAQGEVAVKMLNVNAGEIARFKIYDRNNAGNSVVEINEKELLEEWAFILHSCQKFNPNHPRYGDNYIVILEQDDEDPYIYELDADTKVPGTIDLTLLEKDKFGTGSYYLGTYPCAGLSEFISKILTE